MNKKIIFLYFFIVVLFLLVGIYISKNTKSTQIQIKIPKIVRTKNKKESAMVKRVIDGDTIVLSDDRRVRYIGINTPELHSFSKSAQCFGTEAAAFNKKLVEGKEITLQKDVSDTDKYGRLLRYVWVGNIFVNEYLVKEGYALQATYPPDVRYALLFQKAAENARINNKGLWKTCR